MGKERSLADDLREEEKALTRRFIHHTRPKEPMSLKKAMELCQQMAEAADGRR